MNEIVSPVRFVAFVLVWVSGSVHDSAERNLAQQETQLREARLRIQNAGNEAEMIGRYLAAYQQLARAGFVGEEQRINWLDSLRLANEEARIFGVEYDIGTQKPYAYAAEFDVGPMLLQESTMQLRLRLLHEEDEVRTLPPVALSRGCRCSPDYIASVIARFPPEEQAAMVGDDGLIRADCAFCATSFPIAAEAA